MVGFLRGAFDLLNDILIIIHLHEMKHNSLKRHFKDRVTYLGTFDHSGFLLFVIFLGPYCPGPGQVVGWPLQPGQILFVISRDMECASLNV